MNSINKINPIQKSATAVLLFIVLSYWNDIAVSADVRVLQSDKSGVLIEYTPVYQPPIQTMINGKRYSSYKFDGYRVPPKSVPGTPEIFERLFTIRFPGKDANSVDIIKTAYEDFPSVDLAPFPNYHKGDFGLESFYPEHPRSVNSTGYLPVNIARLSGIGETRGAFLGSLRISPLQFNPNTRSLRKYNLIVCRINFGPASAVHSVPDEMLGGVALNDDQFSTIQRPGKMVGKISSKNSVLATGILYRFPITEEGIYKITGQMLLDAGIPPNTDPAAIKIYNNGGFELPADPSLDTTDDLVENAVQVFDTQRQHALDPADYIIFYGNGTRGWNYDSVTHRFSHYINHFTETNYYWLKVEQGGGGSSKQMVVNNPLPVAVYPQPTTVTAKIFREDEMVNILNSGMEWLGQSLSIGNSVSYVHPLPALDHTQKILYHVRWGAQDFSYSNFTLYDHEVPVGGSTIYPIGSGDYDIQLNESDMIDSLTPSFTDDQSSLRILYSSNSGNSGTGYLDWYEIFYQRKLIADNDIFAFSTPVSSGILEYKIGGFTNSHTIVYDVTNFQNVSIVPAAIDGSNNTVIDLQFSIKNVRKLFVVGPNGYKTPGTMQRMNNQNLHGAAGDISYIIVTHSDFRPAADRLKNYRELPGNSYLKTLVVEVDTIYNEFGGGLPSPEAIRDYLRYMYENSGGALKYVLLFGDGNFDYKGIISTSPNWIPAWETPESFSPLDSYASDDDYGIFYSGGIVNVGIGRLTSQSLAGANTMVSKIIDYESNSVVDAWKTRITFVADDSPSAPGVFDGFNHVNDAEGVAAQIPALFKKDKIYLAQYPTVYTASGRRKPDVNTAIVNNINDGALILNFTGHGNPRLWTHEEVFVRETDFPLLHNKGKYFFLIAATCNFSLFDGIDNPSGGEVLAAIPDAGAIGVFSATRAVFEDSNHYLNLALVENLFTVDSTGRYPRRIGSVVYRTKKTLNDDNDRKYFLLGDPALQIGYPKLNGSIDSVDHKPGTTVVQLQALSPASVNVSVLDSTNAPNPSFNGKALTEVFDADKTVQIEDVSDNLGDKIYEPISLAGDVLFRGEATVSNGKMHSNFIVPKDISYSNANGKIGVYFWNSTIDGAGFTQNVKIGGTDSTAVADTKGPSINIYIDSRSFHSGDVVGADPLLLVDLEDDHGINTSGASVGHRLEAWLDGASQSIDLTNSYQSAPDNYQKGTIEYTLGALPTGTHRLRLRAWDTYNNPSIGEAVFDVVTAVGLQLTNVFNYPNPFSSSTIFTFEHNQIGKVKADVKIYTVAGRLIRSINADNLAAHNRVVQVSWDGRDQDGSRIANGIYLYKIIAKTEDERFASEAYGKISVLH
ncbi:MAG: type IX secretion system sortase PorU [Bacteroidota bacterium]